MSSKSHFWFYASLILLFLQNVHGYRKYFVEDECMPSAKKQKVTLRLPATGPDSVGEIRSNRFGTYSRTERNCVLKLSPPKGYGIILTVLKIDFRSHANCKDFIKILTNDDEEARLCGSQVLGPTNQTFISDGDVKIIYHTSDVGMGFNKGIRLIFTVSKSEDGCSAPNGFKCRNSHCIWAGVTCDGINNCGDSSDENFSDYPYCPEIAPLAITAIVLAIISFITIVAALCICCCRSQPEKPEKPYLFKEFPSSPNGGYIPLPGYSYGSTSFTFMQPQSIQPQSIQPQYCRTVTPSAPVFSPHGCSYATVPLVQQKVEIYEKPPPYDA